MLFCLLCSCEVPENTEEQARMQLLIGWIIDHPNAVLDEEVSSE